MLPHLSGDPPFGPKLAAADGSPIASWGWQELTLCSGHRHFPWQFLRAAVKFPIIGTDFLAHFRLAVDVTAMKLLPHSGLPVQLVQLPDKGIFATLGCSQMRASVCQAERQWLMPSRRWWCTWGGRSMLPCWSSSHRW